MNNRDLSNNELPVWRAWRHGYLTGLSQPRNDLIPEKQILADYYAWCDQGIDEQIAILRDEICRLHGTKRSTDNNEV